MSKPTIPDSEYREAVRAHGLAAAQWLGLDPAQVFRLDLDDRTEIPKFYAGAKWEATVQQQPRTGQLSPPSIRNDIDGEVIFTGELALDYDDGRALYAVIGPKPELFTADERAALERLRP